MMKKNNWLAVSMAILTTAFTACTNSEEITKMEQKVLDFSVFANNTTRAPETTDGLKQSGKAFGVWGYSTFGSDETTVFDNQEVKYIGDKWTYSPLKFWDKLSSYKFYAYYPYGTTGVTINKITGNITVKDFTVEDGVVDHVDLMIADEVARAANATGEVSFNFRHILSNINLKFKKDADIDGTKLTLTSVKLSGMQKVGTFVQTAVYPVEGEWTVSGDEATTPELASNNEVPESTDLTPFFEFPDMLFIPQFTTNLKLNVTYILGDIANGQPFTRELDLSYDSTDRTHNPDSWEVNQKITYNFTINADVIEFKDHVVEGWDTNHDVNVPTIN